MDKSNLLAYFVRHGTTAANEEGLFRGRLNPALDEAGIQDALKLKEYFKHTEFGDAFTSDTLRSQTTAATVLQPHEISPIIVPELNAIDIGRLAGQKKSDHQAEVNYFQNNPNEPFPGGESINQFRGRVRPAISHAIKRGFETGLPSVAFVHSSIIHEVGNMIHGDHLASLVKPGGVVGVFHTGGHFIAKALIKPETKSHNYGS